MSLNPELILYVANTSARTQFILPNEDHIDGLPFDGIVVNIPASWSLFSPDVALDRADVQRWLEPLSDFNADRSNYILTVVDRPGDLFDDAAWDRTIENWRILAEEAKAVGVKGILFDNEEYFGEWQNYPEDFPDATRGLQDYQAQASLRGRQIAEAVAEVFPEAELAVAHGPYLSTDSTAAAPEAIELQAGGPYQYELLGAFFTGLAEGRPQGRTIIDGGELYALRTEAEFEQSVAWRSEGMVGEIDWQVDPELLTNWDARVDQAHMVYTDEFPSGFTQDPQSVEETLVNALRTSEGAVFLYSEEGLPGGDFLTEGGLSQEWRAAVENAVRRAADQAEPEPEPQPEPEPEPQPEPAPDPDVGLLLEGDRRSNELTGGPGDDTLKGWAGSDTLLGEGGEDRLEGGRGRDELHGGDGDDFIFGGGGRDTLYGGSGDDTLRGGDGKDTLYLGAGRDVVRTPQGTDHVRDFDVDQDAIDLTAAERADVSFKARGNRLMVEIGDDTLVLHGVRSDQADDLAFI